MFNVLENCSVCISNNLVMIKVSTADKNEMKFSSKLRQCVPEVDWSDDFNICSHCIEQLETAYTFYQLCLESYEIRKQQESLFVKCKHPTIKTEESYDFRINNTISIKEEIITPVDDECFSSELVVKKDPSSGENDVEKLVVQLEIEELPNNDTNANFEKPKQSKCRRKCDYCSKVFKTKRDLNTHEKKHLNKREYQCIDCPKSFNTHQDLRSHRLVVHTDPSLWDYVCTFCQKRFPIKSNADQHMRRHLGDKRFACHLCEKRFVDKVAMQKHVKSHSNLRAFKCEHCQKEYKDNRVLQMHLTKIHGIGNAKIPVRVKKHFCAVCSKSYFAKNKLTRHMFSHTGEKPYNCHLCERRFTDKSYVKEHLKTRHNVVEKEQTK